MADVAAACTSLLSGPACCAVIILDIECWTAGCSGQRRAHNVLQASASSTLCGRLETRHYADENAANIEGFSCNYVNNRKIAAVMCVYVSACALVVAGSIKMDVFLSNYRTSVVCY